MLSGLLNLFPAERVVRACHTACGFPPEMVTTGDEVMRVMKELNKKE